MPSATSGDNEPVETVSTSIDLPVLPSFMIEPLPKARSICDSAASSALDLSIEAPSITRKAAGAIVRSLCRDSMDRQAGALPAQRPFVMKDLCTLFVLRSQYVLSCLHPPF